MDDMDRRTAMRRRLMWRAGVGTAVAGMATVAAFGFASASTGTPPAQTSSTGVGTAQLGAAPWAGHRGGPWGGPLGGRWGGGWGAPLDVGGGLDGEVLLAKDGGGNEKLLIQRGTVNEVSATSITVKSDDGFTKSYAVNADTDVNGGRDKIDTVATDEKVVVTALQTGGSLTAQHVLDLTDLGAK